jgi:hypothetical protein
MGVERAMHGSPTENDAYEATHAARGLTLQRIDRNGNFSPENYPLTRPRKRLGA